MLHQSSAESLSFLGLADEAPEPLDIDTRASVLIQRMHVGEDGSLSWLTLKAYFHGTIVGFSGNSDVEPDMRVNIIPDQPIPGGVDYGNRHPRLIDCTPCVVLDDQMDQVALRYTVVPRVE